MAGGAIRYERGESVSGRFMESFRSEIAGVLTIDADKSERVPKRVFCCLLIERPMPRYRRLRASRRSAVNTVAASTSGTLGVEVFSKCHDELPQTDTDVSERTTSRKQP